MDESTKAMIKENLEKALDSGKDVLENVKEITKVVTKEIMENSRDQGEDLKTTAGDVLKETFNSLGELGKSSLEYLKAAGAGFMMGLKESGTEDHNLIKATYSSLLDGMKHLGKAGIYVSKETAKNLSVAVESLFSHHDSSSQE
jgi:hypothetical protein